MKIFKFIGALLATFAWAAVTAPSSPKPQTEETWIDLIEVNHFYNKQGIHVYSQVIYWREYPTVGLNRSTLAAVGYQLLGQNPAPGEWPMKTSRGYEQTRLITVENRQKRVTIASRYYRESHTQVDPERESAAQFWKGRGIMDISFDFLQPSKLED